MMNEDALSFALVAALCLFAGVVQGQSGFGFGIVAMSLLPLIVDIRVAAPFVTLLAALACLATLRGHWRWVDWTETRLLFVVLALGLPIGLWGLVSGILSGALNMCGPPLLLYLLGRPIEGHSLVATLHLLFTYSALTRSGLATSFGLVTDQVLSLLAVAALPAVGGMVLGSRIRWCLPARTLNRTLQGMMLLLGAYYLAVG